MIIVFFASFLFRLFLFSFSFLFPIRICWGLPTEMLVLAKFSDVSQTIAPIYLELRLQIFVAAESGVTLVVDVLFLLTKDPKI